MKPILRYAIWQKRWSVLIWCGGVTAFIALNLLLYPTVRDQAAQLNQVLEELPQATHSLFSDSSELLSPTGYLSTRVFYLLLPLLFSVLAIGLGSSLLAKEENDGTIELLLSRPLSRARLLTGKALSGLVILGTIGLAALTSTLFFSWLVEIAVPLKNITLTMVMMLVLCLLFGSAAFLMTALGRWGRAASIGVAVFFALSSYLVTSLSSIASWLIWPSKFLPYHYYRPTEVLEGNFSWPNFLILLSTSLILGILSWIAFRRRDLST